MSYSTTARAHWIDHLIQLNGSLSVRYCDEAHPDRSQNRVLLQSAGHIRSAPRDDASSKGHDVRIVSGRLDTEPKAIIRWLRDIYGNSIAVLAFEQPSDRLRILGEADVDYFSDSPVESLVDPTARFFPFQYPPEEQVELFSIASRVIRTTARSSMSGCRICIARAKLSKHSLSLAN